MKQLENNDLYLIREILKRLSGEVRQPLSYKVAKASKVVRKLISEIEQENTPSPRVQEFLQKLGELQKEHALYSEDGVMETYDVVENGKRINKIKFKDFDAYTAEYKKLRGEYEADLAEQDERHKHFMDLLKAEPALELHKVKKHELPKDIPASYWLPLMFLLEDFSIEELPDGVPASDIEMMLDYLE